MADTISVMFFCLGNICRSPIAEGAFRHLVTFHGRSDEFHIESAGTSAYHVGERPDPGSQKITIQAGAYDISTQRSQQLTKSHVQTFDFVIAMDNSNKRTAQKWAKTANAIILLRDFDPKETGDVPDPWGGGSDGFRDVFDIITRSCQPLLDHIDATYKK